MSLLSRFNIHQEIRKLNRLDPKLASYDAIRTTYERMTDGLQIVVNRGGAHELFYRVRRTNGVKPTKINELGAPPAMVVTGFQRCNPPGIPMFYAASRRIGALIEARVQTGDVVYLSQWIAKDHLPTNKIFDNEQDHLLNESSNISTIRGRNDDLVVAYFDTQFTKRIHEISLMTTNLRQQLHNS